MSTLKDLQSGMRAFDLASSIAPATKVSQTARTDYPTSVTTWFVSMRLSDKHTMLGNIVEFLRRPKSVAMLDAFRYQCLLEPGSVGDVHRKPLKHVCFLESTIHPGLLGVFLAEKNAHDMYVWRE